MNTFKGPFRFVFEDLRLQFYILTGVTSLLSILYILLGIFVSSNTSFIGGASFGPYYGLFFIYPILAYIKGYKQIISFGGTRKQFLISIFANVGLYLVLCMFILNGFYILNKFLVDQGISNATLFHMGDLVNGYGPLLYFWIDVLWGIICFSVAFFICTIWFYYGTLRTIIGATVLALLTITFVTLRDISGIIEFIIVEHFTFLHLLAGVGILLLVFSYLIMKDGPLERCTTARRRTHKASY